MTCAYTQLRPKGILFKTNSQIFYVIFLTFCSKPALVGFQTAIPVIFAGNSTQ
jgi:hypothetical protein